MGAEGKNIISAAAVQDVIACAAANKIIFSAAADPVIAAITEQFIFAGCGKDHIITGTAATDHAVIFSGREIGNGQVHHIAARACTDLGDPGKPCGFHIHTVGDRGKDIIQKKRIPVIIIGQIQNIIVRSGKDITDPVLSGDHRSFPAHSVPCLMCGIPAAGNLRKKDVTGFIFCGTDHIGIIPYHCIGETKCFPGSTVFHHTVIERAFHIHRIDCICPDTECGRKITGPGKFHTGIRIQFDSRRKIPVHGKHKFPLLCHADRVIQIIARHRRRIQGCRFRFPDRDRIQFDPRGIACDHITPGTLPEIGTQSITARPGKTGKIVHHHFRERCRINENTALIDHCPLERIFPGECEVSLIGYGIRFRGAADIFCSHHRPFPVEDRAAGNRSVSSESHTGNQHFPGAGDICHGTALLSR